jgi:hypothetical protein
MVEYFIIAILWGIMFEELLKFAQVESLNYTERFLNILIWPIMVMVFIYKIIKNIK